MTEAALEHLELRELLEVLVERLREVFGADLARILLRDPDDAQRFTVGAAAGFEAEPGTAVEIAGALEEVVRGAPARDARGAAARDGARPGARRRRA